MLLHNFLKKISKLSSFFVLSSSINVMEYIYIFFFRSFFFSRIEDRIYNFLGSFGAERR